MLFFFATSFHIQAAQPIASDNESGIKKASYRNCAQQSSFTKEEFPTLAMRVADKLKYPRENIHVSICKAWPSHPGKSLVALVGSEENMIGRGDVEYDLDVLVVQTQSGAILQRLSQKKGISDDAMRFDSIAFDTANYQLAPGVRAFGLRINHSHNGGTSSFWERLNLYIPHKNKLKSVLLNLTMRRSVWNQGVCADTFSTQRTLAMGNTSHHGYADIALAANNTEAEAEAKMIDGNCPEKKWSDDHTLHYDGVKYIVPAGL
jgi:hypothetical protein